MKWQGGRQSDNVSEATPDDYQQAQDVAGRNPKMMGTKPISQYKLPRTGGKNPVSATIDQNIPNPAGTIGVDGGTDASFFKHNQQGKLNGY